MQLQLPAAVARALFQNCCADVDPFPAHSLDIALGAEAPGLAAQILALQARSGGEIDSSALRKFCDAFPEGEWNRRREVLSIEECAREIDAGERRGTR